MTTVVDQPPSAGDPVPLVSPEDGGAGAQKSSGSWATSRASDGCGSDCDAVTGATTTSSRAAAAKPTRKLCQRGRGTRRL